MDVSFMGNIITIHIQVLWAVASLVLAALLLIYAGQSRKQ